MSARTHLALAAVLTLGAMLALAAPSFAAFGASTFSVITGDPRAGAHGDITADIVFNTHLDATSTEVPDGSVKTIDVDLPAGLVGNPTATPRCTATEFSTNTCPLETVVGTVTLDADLGFGRGPGTELVYNVVPNPGEPATFAFKFGGLVTVQIHTRVRSGGDYGLTTTIRNINQAVRLYGTTLTLWGVPADPSHDGDRGGPSTASRVPFMRTPTRCDSGALTARLQIVSWQQPGEERTADTTLAAPSDCANVPFAPSVAVVPDTAQPDAPTGLTVDVDVPQSADPGGRASADLRRAVVTLPEGLTLSPGVGDGLQACTPEQFARTSAAASRCPDASVIGSATIDSPLQPDPLTGPIALGPSGDGTYRVFVDAATDGVRVKVAGDIVPDPATGRLTATFDDNPQLPFSRFRLRFDGGPRAALATPAACGTGATSASLLSWSGVTRPATATTAFGGDCARPFAPGFTAGTTSLGAGRATGLTVQLARPDRTQELGEIASVRLPAGLMANIGSVPPCAVATACGAESRIGSVTVGAGPGEAPLHLGGTAYLTQGYKGAPWGMALTIRALAGPVDLGTVVVRAAIRVGADGRITVETDPLPRILGGIPLRLRSVALTLDRPGFMLNPTSCDPSQIAATLKSTDGATVERSSRFQVAGCDKLPFAPALTATASRGKGKAAGLKVRIAQKPGEANMRSVVVELSKRLGVSLDALKTVCSAEQAARDACPAGARVGSATATTAILAQPLSGPVMVVDSGGPLPKLVAQLRGPGFTLPLEGATALTKGGQVRTTFAAIPDVPLRSFELDLPATGNPVLQASSLPCAGLKLVAGMTAQNGARRTASRPIAVRCTAAQQRPRVTGRSLSGSTLVLKVAVSGPGTVRVTGAGLRTTTRKVTAAGTTTVRAPLTARAARTARRTGRFASVVRVGYGRRSAITTTRTTRISLRASRRSR